MSQNDQKKTVTRRELFKLAAITAGGLAVAAVPSAITRTARVSTPIHPEKKPPVRMRDGYRFDSSVHALPH